MKIKGFVLCGAMLWVLVAVAGVGDSACVAQQGGGPPAKPDNYLAEASAGAEALQTSYVPSMGLYQTTGWWNAANAITTLVNYSKVSGSRIYMPVIANTFERAPAKWPGFLNKYYDDEGWWALAWIDAYDVTHDARYLAMAESIFTDMAAAWDTETCGGGIWWSKDRKYKNAIANELFLSVAAHLANRVGDPVRKASYRGWALKEWQWFRGTGMINAQHLVNDGMVSTDPKHCVNNERTTWTYNQGVVLAGLVELNHASPDAALPAMAREIAGATLLHLVDDKGILHDTCEPQCGEDGVQFKGIFVRNLADLNEAFPDARYAAFTKANADSIWMQAQGENHQFGETWSGPYRAGSGAGAQSSALDALVAAAAMSPGSTSTNGAVARVIAPR